MRLRMMPQTDLEASVICLGGAQIGSGINEDDSFRLLDQFVDEGGNFIDTSLNYADWGWPVKGISEKTIGKWLKYSKKAGRIIVGTKGACPRPAEGQFFRLSRAEIEADLHQSLQNLQIDRIDLYWLHRDDPSQPVEAIIDGLNDQVKAGKIRYFGCSNWTLPRIQQAQAYASSTGQQTFVANQMMWSLAQANPDQVSDRTLVLMDEAMRAYHEEQGLAAVPFASQAGGFFSEKYRQSAPHKPSLVKLYYNEVSLGRFARIREVADQKNVSPTAVALACFLIEPFAVYPIIGCRNADQLQDSCIAGRLELDESVVQYIKMGT